MNNTDMEFLPDDFDLVGSEKISQIDEAYSSKSYWHDILSRFTRNKGAIAGLVYKYLKS